MTASQYQKITPVVGGALGIGTTLLVLTETVSPAFLWCGSAMLLVGLLMRESQVEEPKEESIFGEADLQAVPDPGPTWWFARLKEAVLGVLNADPLQETRDAYVHMLGAAAQMVRDADSAFWDATADESKVEALYRRDVRLNKAERRLRKRAMLHAMSDKPGSTEYGLLLMNLVKDTERLGDYAKNLAELSRIDAELSPDDPIVAKLRRVSERSVVLADHSTRVMQGEDREGALALVREGQALRDLCEEVLKDVITSDYSAAPAIRVALGARFYKRVVCHLVNVLSSNLMPLHKLDYVDEKLLEPAPVRINR